MNRDRRALDRAPALLTTGAVAALAIWGPIGDLPGYHDFADRRAVLGIPNGLDVLSNAGFALVGVWGGVVLWRARGAGRRRGLPGMSLFCASLALTAVGSSFYHLAPGDGRLLWDRLPIALGCAGLLSAVYAESHDRDGRTATLWLGAAAVASVCWWWATAARGEADLRPYLLLQFLPLALVPLWQAASGAPRRERLAFGTAILLYLVAKAAELGDETIFEATGLASGHTIKHVLATAATALIVASARAGRRGPGGP